MNTEHGAWITSGPGTGKSWLGQKITEEARKRGLTVQLCAPGHCACRILGDDAITLHRLLKARMTMFEHTHRRQPNVTAIAQMLSTVLYGRRFSCL